MKKLIGMIVFLLGLSLGLLFDMVYPFSSSTNEYKTALNCADNQNNSLGLNDAFSAARNIQSKPLEQVVSENVNEEAVSQQPKVLSESSIEIVDLKQLELVYSQQKAQFEEKQKELVSKLLNRAELLEVHEVEELAQVLSMVSLVKDDNDIKIPDALIRQSLESLSYRYDVPTEARIKLLSSFQYSITSVHYDALLDLSLNVSDDSVAQESALIADLILRSDSDDYRLKKSALEKMLAYDSLSDSLKNRIIAEFF